MSTLFQKWLTVNSVNGSHIRLVQGQSLRSLNAAGTSDINIFQIDATNFLRFQTQPKADDTLPLPAAAKDYVTLEWVQNYFNGKKDPKESVDAVILTNVPLTGTTPLIGDGWTFRDGDYAGLVAETNQAQNGPYLVTISGGNYTLTRRFDFNSNVQVSKGAYFPIINGTDYAGGEVILNTDNPINLDTTPLNFVVYQSAASLKAGDMLVRSGNTFSVGLATISGLESTTPGLAGGKLRVKVDPAALEQNQTTKIDSATNALLAKKSRKDIRTISSQEVTNGYMDLIYTAEQDSVEFQPQGAGYQVEGIDYGVNYTAANGKTRITFMGGLITGGISAMIAGDIVAISYRSF